MASQPTSRTDTVARPLSTARVLHDEGELPGGSHRQLLELHAHVVFGVDADLRLVSLSPGWEELSGMTVEASLGTPLGAFLRCRSVGQGPVDLDLDDLAGGPTTATLRHADGPDRTVELKAIRSDPATSPIAAIGTLTDVTARADDELQLRHSQKLEAVGRLAAGIAHEINTPIQFIGDNLDFLSESFGRVVELLDRYRDALAGEHGHMPWDQRQAMLRSAEDQSDIEFVRSEFPDAVDSALDGTRRVASIVRAMKAFGHPDRAEPQAVDVNEVLTNTLIVARNQLKYVADVEAELGDLPIISANPGDLGQVFLNLLVNAADAIALGTGAGAGDELGRVTVTSEHVGDRVVVSVGDTGPGIPDEVADRIFEPFFTTKEVGQGTGQGLPLAQALVRNHRGSIWFDTTLGAGTTFFVSLPADRDHPAEPATTGEPR